jgi:hypothetical protein
MRIAAGVLLIIAAVLNLFASFGYLGGGAFSSGVGSVSNVAYEASMSDPNVVLTAAETEMADQMADEVSGGLKSMGSLLMGMGVLLLVSVGVLIAGAVFLFQSKQAKFAMLAGAMALLCEGLGMSISSFGVMNIIGLVGGIMAILAARSYAKPPAADPVAA